jgi:hypothetical protein
MVTGVAGLDEERTAREIVAEYASRIQRDGALRGKLAGRELDRITSLTHRFLAAELRGQAALTPWTDVRAAFLTLGMSEVEYRSALGHFVVSLFSSALAPVLAARIAARIEWSAIPARGAR